MPKLAVIDFLRQRRKRYIPSDVFKAGSVLNIGEGAQNVLTYTSAADKMKVFSAFIREGLENGDRVDYVYPDEERETVRAKLKKYGIDVKKHERKGDLDLTSLTEYYMPEGKLDYEKAIMQSLSEWTETNKKGYKHVRDLEDLGDFSFANGQWQKWITEYWLDPRWDDPNVSEWVETNEWVGAVYVPFIMDITAVNVEHMTETEVTELLKTFGGGTVPAKRFFIDLLEDESLFSRSVGLNHQRLLGRKILVEFDPVSNYEKIVDRLARESMANVEPIFVFTSNTSPIYTYLANQSTIKFFLTSLSTSTPKSVSENKVLLPAKSAPLILDTLNKVLETNADANACFVFDILSELLTTIGQEKTFTFLRHTLDLLSSENVTGLFLFNTSAHEPQLASQIRGLFHNLLTYEQTGLKIVKIS